MTGIAYAVVVCFALGFGVTGTVLLISAGANSASSQDRYSENWIDDAIDTMDIIRSLDPVVDTKAVRAITQCPRCHDIGVHWLREPTGQAPNWVTLDHGLVICAVDDPSASVGRSGDVEEIRRFGADSSFRTITRTYVTLHGITMPARKVGLDERDLAVVRECRSCGHEWGQR